MTQSAKHILINALAMGSGGGLTVGREVLRGLAEVRPHWRISFALIEGHPLHEKLRDVAHPSNVTLIWAPNALMGRPARQRWEKNELAKFADDQNVDAVVQLNGMLIPTMRPPTLCHMQDPWPYRPQAWEGMRDRFVALLKRREHKHTLEHAACFGWTSAYLRDLICGHHNIWPKCSEVLYNGVPSEWIDRARNNLPPWDSRPNEIVTVSNVNVYKRQSLVIEALPHLIKRPGLSDVIYRIVGAVEPPEYRDELMAIAKRHGVADRVKIEGRVGDEQMTQFLSGAKCFVLMSVCESFGIPAVEAMSFGTPVVTADCCAMPEVCGDAAELAPVDDAVQLADRIARVMLDAPHAEDLRRKGAVRIAKFSWTDVATRMAQLLENL